MSTTTNATEVALHLYARIGVTYGIIGWTPVDEVRPFDLLICPDEDCRCAVLVRGSRIEGDINKMHLMREGNTWEQRFTERYPRDMHLYVARSIWAPAVEE